MVSEQLSSNSTGCAFKGRFKSKNTASVNAHVLAHEKGTRPAGACKNINNLTLTLTSSFGVVQGL